MRTPSALAMAFLLLATPGYGAPTVTTSNVNFRQGPGTSHPSIGVVPAGTEVDVAECNASGSWCAIAYDGRNGFVSGRYLQETEPEAATGWPRAFRIGDKALLVLYQPQVTDWKDFRQLDALVAAEYRETDEATPVFGVIGLSAQTTRDKEAGSLTLHDLTVTQLDFSALERADLTTLALNIGELLPTDPVSVSEVQVTASLANTKQIADQEGLKADPPRIFVVNGPARLLQTDGEPVFAPVKGAPGVEFVVNTNWDLLRTEDALWLRDDTHWQTAAAITGPWKPATDLPEALSSLPDDGNWTDTLKAMPPAAYEADAEPKIVVSDSPAELIRFDGPQELEAVPGTGLEWAANTEADLFRKTDTGIWYFLVSGRWFSAEALTGPWTFATPDLPDDFRNIPEDVPYYSVRASVPGTSEANEARLRASIPETARVEPGGVTPTVTFDGEPVFVAIEGTDLSYAQNSESQIIQVGDRYYLVQDGIWFVADDPAGPWALAREVPPAIYTIPASSPVHNVTYVRVYHSEPEAVWYGYTSGYLFGYLAWGTLVYGTGWRYPPYWRWGPRPIYFPRPVTFGIGAYYNPARGIYGRYGYAYGPYRGITARAAWNPATGTYVRGARIYGPGGSAGFVSAWNPRTGTRAVARGGSSVYGRWGAASVRRGSDYVRAAGASGRLGGRGMAWDSSRGQGGIVSGRRGNVYAGRNGSVYRNVGEGWQKWDNGGWNNVRPPDRSALNRSNLQGARDRVGKRPAAGRPGANRPAGNRPGVNRPAGNRPAANRPGNRPAVNRPANRPGANRPANRPAANRPAANRPAANRPANRPAANRPATRNRAPAHLNRDYRARQRSNQHRVQRRHSRPANVSRNRARASAAARGGNRGGYRRGMRR